MPTQADYQNLLGASLSDSDVLELYNAQDPRLIQQLNAIAGLFVALGKEMDVSEIEPFIKSRERSIIADATNKGILPTGTPCQHTIMLSNTGYKDVTLSQGRLIEDNAGGRNWRLMTSATVKAQSSINVAVEQSEYREVKYTIPITEIFHKVSITTKDDMFLSGITIKDDAVTPNIYQLTRRWINAMAGDYCFNLTMDSLQRLFIQFGDSSRAGITAQSGQVFTIGLTETYGSIDHTSLSDGSLASVETTDEQKISVQFVSGGLIQTGANPLTVDQLRILSSYPSIYDENAVFLANFDYLVRQKYMAKTSYIAVWNENVQQQFYGATYKDINHLNIAVVSKNTEDQSSITASIQQTIATADSLYRDRVNVKAVEEVPYNLTITGSLGAVHDVDAVKAQIKTLLVANYGKGQLSSSRWLQNGFNTQEISTLIRQNISAFQDRISDFSLTPSSRVNKPHEWVYMTSDSITISLTKTAENMGSTWSIL
ncbi:MAG: hypothetical protein [Bacteriophage sp.]|nr:MAG: hypothetical protein [Bacteriophage sp.]